MTAVSSGASCTGVLGDTLGVATSSGVFTETRGSKFLTFVKASVVLLHYVAKYNYSADSLIKDTGSTDHCFAF